MKRFRDVFAFAAAFAAAVVVCAASPRQAILANISGAELSVISGAACETGDGSATFCTVSFCQKDTTTTPVTYKHHRGTNRNKAWCSGANVHPPQALGVCNCNQTGVPWEDCIELATCSGATGTPPAPLTCTGCGTYNVIGKVQTSVNLGGKTCSKDADCE